MRCPNARIDRLHQTPQCAVSFCISVRIDWRSVRVHKTDHWRRSGTGPGGNHS